VLVLVALYMPLLCDFACYFIAAKYGDIVIATSKHLSNILTLCKKNAKRLLCHLKRVVPDPSSFHFHLDSPCSNGMYLAYLFPSVIEDCVGLEVTSEVLEAAQKRFADELPDSGVRYENMGSCNKAADRFRREYKGWDTPYQWPGGERFGVFKPK
jgi:hypothetical protein